MYIDRIRTIITIIKKLQLNPKDILIGDFACAQGNIGLILAELGYKVYAIDIDPISIEYSKMKYEKGNIHWLVCNILDLDIPKNIFDIAIVGELIEHCAYPENIIKKILGFIRSGGYLILTTPNGSRPFKRFPTYLQVIKNNKRKSLEKKQFRPSSEGHLFFFKLDEIKYILPENAKIIEKGYCGGIILFNIYTKHLLRLFPIKFIEHTSKILPKIPVIRTLFSYNIYAVIIKN